MKPSIRRVKALIIKEFYQMIRDISSLLISVVLPLILLFIYGYGVSLDMNHMRIGLVMEDTAPDAQSFARSLMDSPFFDVTLSRNQEPLNHKIITGDIRGIVVIPSYFSEFRQRQGYKSPIQVIADGSEPNTANFVQNYVNASLQNWLQQESISEKAPRSSYINPQVRFWYNEELESRYFLIPGSIAIIMTLIGTLLTALVVAREWERGSMEALMSTPVTIGEIIVGKLFPYFCLGMVSMTICFLVAVFYYQIPFRGSFWLLVFVAGSFLLSALGLGLLISTVTKNQFLAAQVAIVAAFFPAFILSGFVFEISSMPLPIRLFTYLIPARYFVTCLQTLFLAGDIWRLILFNILPILGIGAFIIANTTRITVKRLD